MQDTVFHFVNKQHVLRFIQKGKKNSSLQVYQREDGTHLLLHNEGRETTRTWTPEKY